MTLPKPELGARRRCLSCNAAFFDLNRDPIICVKCGTTFHIVEFPRLPPRRAWAKQPAAVGPAPIEDDVEPAAEGDAPGEEATILQPDEDDEGHAHLL
jgi:uncharacterized protein (TIGR02300 family)